MKNISIHSCCEILNVSPQSNVDEIKARTRQLLLKYHPDVNLENKSFFEEKTREILTAYEVLLKIKSEEKIQSEDNFSPSQSNKEEVSPSKNISLVVFKITNVKYGVSVDNVQEILRAKDITIWKVQNRTNHMFGFTLWREKIVPIYDLKNNCIDEINGEQIIVVTNHSKIGGLLVDKVSEVINIPSNFENIIRPSYNNYLIGTYRANGDVFCILNIDKIIC